MCMTCYADYGSPQIVTPRTIEVAAMIDAIYVYSCVGSNAHIVVDDWNLEDENIEYCLNTAIPENFHNATPEQLQGEIVFLTAMQAMSVEERASAMAIHEGWLEARE